MHGLGQDILIKAKYHTLIKYIILVQIVQCIRKIKC